MEEDPIDYVKMNLEKEMDGIARCLAMVVVVIRTCNLAYMVVKSRLRRQHPMTGG